jgi:hypothetical protein
MLVLMERFLGHSVVVIRAVNKPVRSTTRSFKLDLNSVRDCKKLLVNIETRSIIK